MNLADLHKVWEVKALKKAGEEEAKKLLEKIAKQVQPIMRKRKWTVKLLSEFCPNNPSLLGLNVGGGEHVKLRLRRPDREWDFFPFDQILDTMLHELCHNVHGPHNATFYKLWDELRKECEELMMKGISGTGQGFDLPGRRLGGFSQRPPLSSLRQTALAAAENRARLGSLLPSGPKRLGGDSNIMVALSPIQAAAMAAERRLQDEIWCGSHSSEASDDHESCSNTLKNISNMEQSAGRLRTNDGSTVRYLGESENSWKRNHEPNNCSAVDSAYDCSESKFVDLSADAFVTGSKLGDESRSSKQSSTSHSFPQPTSSASSAGSMLNRNSPSSVLDCDMWECGTCTLLNPLLALVCEACTAEKPRDIGTKHKFWSCKFCTLENSVKLDKCAACDQWRYSYGPPLSTPAPHLGT